MTTNKLNATFLGVSTILFFDGETSLLIDGFLSRPSLLQCLFGRIKPDEEVIDPALKRASIDDRLQAVLVSHSHYDHALDAPAICKRTDARLIGSKSTRMIGIGYGLSDDQIQIVKDGDVLEFGAFRVTVFTGIHSLGDRFPGEITEPVQMPCSMSSLRTGEVYSWLVEHGSSKIFVHPSANFISDKFRDVEASVLFLGVAPIGKQPVSFRQQYWEEVVKALGPGKVIPIHWDNFWVSLTSPLRPLPWWADRWSVVEKWLRDNCASAGVDLQYLKAWETIEL